MTLGSAVQALLMKLPEASRDDFIAVIVIDQAARNPSMTLPPDLVRVVDVFIRRAGVPTAAPPEKIWAAIDKYLASAPIDPAAVAELKAALKEHT